MFQSSTDSREPRGNHEASMAVISREYFPFHPNKGGSFPFHPWGKLEAAGRGGKEVTFMCLNSET